MKRRYYPRELFPAVCVVCLQRFQSKQAGTIYCSNACCQQAYNERKRAKGNANPTGFGTLAGDESEQLGGAGGGEGE